MELGKQQHAFLCHNTKKYILLLVGLFITTIGFSQTQHGYVKTRGRLDSKGNLIPGHGLKGAIISIKDHTSVLVESDNGAFSFPVPDKHFRIDSVRKNGYQLVDMDACPRIYKHSSNPLYLVMDTPEQLAQDQLNSERKIRRTLQQQLQKREEELEALKEAHKITVEEYQEALRKLYLEQQGNEKLISDMAKRYAELDYDQLNEFYRQVSFCIENGELVKADSLLRSRGDIQKQVEEILQQGKTIQEGKEQLQKAEAVHEADIEEAAQRCYGFYENYKAQYKLDTAIMFLELRARLDTMNADWQHDAGFYLYFIGQIEKGAFSLNRALTIYQDLAKIDSSTYYPKIAFTLSNLGNLHASITFENCLTSNTLEDLEDCLNTNSEHIIKAEEYLQEAIRIYNVLVIVNPKEYEELLFLSIDELYDVYMVAQNYEKCEDLLTNALKTKLNESNTASVMRQLAELYLKTNRIEEGEQLYKNALGVYRQIADSDTTVYESNYLIALTTFADFYKNNGRFSESEELHKEAIRCCLRFAKSSPLMYMPTLAQELADIAIMYKEIGALSQAEQSFQDALSAYRLLVESAPEFHNMGNAFVKYRMDAELVEYEDKYKEPLARVLLSLANLYITSNRIEECEKFQKEAVEIYQQLAHTYPDIYEIKLAQTYFDIANLYREAGALPQAEQSFDNALSTYRHLTESGTEYDTQIALISFVQGTIKAQNGHYEESICLLEAFLNSPSELSNNVEMAEARFMALYLLSALYANEKNYDKAYQTNETLLQIMMGIYQNDPSSIQNEFVEVLVNQSFCAIFKKKFEQAEQYARQGLTIDPTKHFTQTNLAAALLFQNKYNEAEDIYRQYKEELKDSFLQDLQDFEAAGVIPKECKADVEKIRKILNE